MGPEDEPPEAPSSRSSSTDDFCYVFVVELERGPSGLGMGLIDGMVSAPPPGSARSTTPQHWPTARVLITRGRGGSSQESERREGPVWARGGRAGVQRCPCRPAEATASPPAHAAGCPRALHPDPAPGQSRGVGRPTVPGRPHPRGERKQPDGRQLPEVRYPCPGAAARGAPAREQVRSWSCSFDL